MLLQLSRYEVVLGYRRLLLRKVSAHLYHLHPVPECRLDGGRGVGRRDEQHVGEVVVYVQIVVMERGVLLRVERLQQCGRRVPLEIAADLVYLV